MSLSLRTVTERTLVSLGRSVLAVFRRRAMQCELFWSTGSDNSQGPQAGATLSPHDGSLERGALPSRVPDPAVFTGAGNPAPFRRPTQQEQHTRRRPYPKQKTAMARATPCRIKRRIWVELHMSWGGRGARIRRSGGKRLTTCTHAHQSPPALAPVLCLHSWDSGGVLSGEEGVGGGEPPFVMTNGHLFPGAEHLKPPEDR